MIFVLLSDMHVWQVKADSPKEAKEIVKQFDEGEAHCINTSDKFEFMDCFMTFRKPDMSLFQNCDIDNLVAVRWIPFTNYMKGFCKQKETCLI